MEFIRKYVFSKSTNRLIEETMIREYRELRELVGDPLWDNWEEWNEECEWYFKTEEYCLFMSSKVREVLQTANDMSSTVCTELDCDDETCRIFAVNKFDRDLVMYERAVVLD